jgi:MSHA pilin protein MshC
MAAGIVLRRDPAGVRHRFLPARPGGFTMVELVIVIVLVGVLGAIGAARFFNRTGFDAAAFADRSTGMLRYAQKLAVAQNRNIYVQATSQGLRLCYSNASLCPMADQVRAPSGSNSGSSASRAFCALGGSWVQDWECEGVPAGASMSLSQGAIAAFYFNGLGRPYLPGDAADSSFTGLTLTITGDDVSRTVSVAQETGYVY